MTPNLKNGGSTFWMISLTKNPLFFFPVKSAGRSPSHFRKKWNPTPLGWKFPGQNVNKFSRFYWRYHGRDSSWIMHMFFDWLGVSKKAFTSGPFGETTTNAANNNNNNNTSSSSSNNNNNNNNRPLNHLNHLNHLPTLLISFMSSSTADLLLHSQAGWVRMRWDEKKRLWVQDSAAVFLGTISGRWFDFNLIFMEWSCEKRELPHEKLRSILSTWTPPVL